MPQTIAQPGVGERMDLDALVNEAADEAVATELAGQETVSAEDLRTYLGNDAGDLSDDELMAAYEKSKAGGEDTPPEVRKAEAAPPAETPPAEAPPVWDRPWFLTKDDGTKVTDISKLAAKDLLELGITYPAGGRDQRRRLDEVIRLAQRIPLDEQRITGLTTQVRERDAELTELRTLRLEAENERRTWLWALQDPTGARLAALQEKFLAAGPPAVEEPAATSDDSYSAGVQFFQTTYAPRLAEVARRYSQDGNAPAPEVVQHLTSELQRFFLEKVGESAALVQDPRYSDAVIQQILEFDIPAALGDGGFVPVRSTAAAPARPAAPATPAPETAALRAEVENLRTELAKSRVTRAPGAGGGTAPGAGGRSMNLDKVKSLRDITDMLSDPEETFGL